MFAVAVGGFGLVVGAALAVLVESVPDRSGGGRAPLSCAGCGATRGATALVPILGALRPCPACAHRHRVMPILVEVTTAAVFAILAAMVGARWHLLPLLGFAAALIALSAVDIERFRLPDRILFPAFGASVGLIALVALLEGPDQHLIPALVGSAAYFLFLLVPNLVSPAGLAFGDVKLALLLGLFVGWTRPHVGESLVLVIYALIIGMVLGVVSGVLVGAGRRLWGPDFLADPDADPSDKGPVPIMRTAFPFGPALAISAFLVVLSSNALIGSPGLL